MTIQQNSNKLAIDWQSFSIGQGNSVTFNQPSATSVALNRVLGSDVSTIQGELHANGQVFLINPNGIVFSPTAQVNVGALVASTLNLSNSDFLAGNYKFSGGSGNAIINEGNVTAANGGTLALIAATITNSGTLNAPAGSVLLGAGSELTLDMGGPVKLQVSQAAINALISNGGIIKADGGTILLTARAAGDLISTTINNTGIIEAQTLATGEQGHIALLGDMDNGHIVVGGTLDASAPFGGDGGNIETSANHVSFADNVQITTKAASGNAGQWLIDPVNFTIAASGGDISGATLEGLLASSNVRIETNTGSNSSTNLYGTTGSAGDINVNDAVAWSTNKLTLSAYNNINVNATLNATGTASLAFEYGQGTATGTGSTYTVANNAQILIPAGTAFTWKKGSAGAVTNLVLNNGLLRFGYNGQASINSDGQLVAPFYFDDVTTGRNGWYQLTCCGLGSTYPLDIQIGVNGDGTVGTSGWNTNGQLLSTNGSGGDTYGAAITSRSLNISKYLEGTGTIISSVTLAFPSSGPVVKVDNTYTLAANSQYLQTTTSITNVGTTALTNLRLWVGTRDDFIGTSDSNYKVKGNLDSSGFVPITTADTQAKAVKIEESTDGVTGAAIMFYSTSSGADTAINYCCSFSNVTRQDPRTSQTTTPTAQDGSYALFDRLSNLAVGQNDSMTWYYAAAPASQIAQAINQVANAAGVTPAPAVVPATTPFDTAVHTAQTVTSAGPVLPGRFVPLTSPNGSENVAPLVGGLQVTAINTQTASGSGNSSGNAGQGDADAKVNALIANSNSSSGLMTVFVVDGGVKLPATLENAQ